MEIYDKDDNIINKNRFVLFNEINDSIYFMTIINGIKFLYLDLWSEDLSSFDVPLKIKNLSIRYDFHNYHTKVINYTNSDKMTLKELLESTKHELMINFNKIMINHHNLKSIIKNNNENIWYLCWDD